MAGPRTGSSANLLHRQQLEAEAYRLRGGLLLESVKSLRAEIDSRSRINFQIELYAIGASVAYYAWLITHCIPDGAWPVMGSWTPKPSTIAWCLPVAMALLGMLRSRTNSAQIGIIGAYLREIEDWVHAPRRQGDFPARGWETYLWIETTGKSRDRKAAWHRRLGAKLSQSSHELVWVVLVLLTAFLAICGEGLNQSACRAEAAAAAARPAIAVPATPRTLPAPQ